MALAKMQTSPQMHRTGMMLLKWIMHVTLRCSAMQIQANIILVFDLG